jgi:hypothetical protein
MFLSYNSLPHPDEQPRVSDGMLKELGEVFVRHGAQDIFGIHLLHSHFTAPQGTALLGVDFPMTDKTQACWTKPVPAEEMMAKPLHGHVFCVQPDGALIAYEFHEGKADFNEESVQPAFFREFAEFLQHNHLASLLALELLDGHRDHTKTELQVGPLATVNFHENDVFGLDPQSITTGWSFQVGDDGIISCKGGNVYAAKKNTHQVFTDSKPLPTVEALKDALRAQGIIA